VLLDVHLKAAAKVIYLLTAAGGMVGWDVYLRRSVIREHLVGNVGVRHLLRVSSRADHRNSRSMSTLLLEIGTLDAAYNFRIYFVNRHHHPLRPPWSIG
jgi:hypothetical protein